MMPLARRAALLMCLLAALSAGCTNDDKASTPTEPAAPVSPNVPDSNASTALTLTVGAVELTFGESTTVFVTVSDTSVLQVGLSTDLGNFGTDNGGNALSTVALDVTSGSASTTFFAGDTEGTAEITAHAGSTTVLTTVTISAPPPLFLESLSPDHGNPQGGTQVTIFGTGFDTTNPPRVTFGGVLATLQENTVTENRLTVVTPQAAQTVEVGEILRVDVTVTNPPDSGTSTAESDTLEGAFAYAHGDTPIPPAVISVSPTSGPNSGGTSVTLSGTGFEPQNVRVVFGFGSSADAFSGAEATVTSSKEQTLTVRSPAAAADMTDQTVDILVRNESTGLFDVAGSAFTYGGSQSITNLRPTSGPYRGGTEVQITVDGLDAEAAYEVEFGGAFQAICPSGSNCTVNASAGVVTILETSPVLVTNCSPPSGAVTMTDRATGETLTGPVYSYTVEEPVVESLQPNSGGAAGGETLRLFGAFSTTEQTVVLIDGNSAAVDSSTSNSSRLRVTVPAFSGTFDTADCDSNGDGATDGVQSLPKTVDILVRYPSTGCSQTLSGIYSYVPIDSTCRVADTELPKAAFTFTVTDPDQFIVSFTDTSSPQNTFTRRRWTFGDGASCVGDLTNGTDTCTSGGTSGGATAPVHTYSAPGTYTVTLDVENDLGGDSISQQVAIEPVDAPEAAFTFAVDSDDATGLTVIFDDLSTGTIDSYRWLFGDGGACVGTASKECHSGSGDTLLQPVHTFPAAGTYEVVLIVSNDAASSRTTREITVGGVGDTTAPSAAFTFSLDPSDSTGLTVVFTDLSTGTITNWRWLFGDTTSCEASAAGDDCDTGDGSTSGPVLGPTHVFPATGSYEVVLVVSNSAGSDLARVTLDLGDSGGNLPNEPTASFEVLSVEIEDPPPVSPPPPTSEKIIRVTLQNTSNADEVTSITWEFGDGASCTGTSLADACGSVAGSTLGGPIHIYASEFLGTTVTITLEMVNAAGSSIASRTVDIPSS